MRLAIVTALVSACAACSAPAAAPSVRAAPPSSSAWAAPAIPTATSAPTAEATAPEPAAELAPEQPPAPASSNAPGETPAPPPIAPKGVLRAETGDAAVGPAYPPELVRRVVHQQKRALLRCSERHARSSSKPASVRFTIGPLGTVTHAELVGVAQPDALQTCLLTVIRGLEFPRPEGSITVTYPVNVDPAN